MEGFEVPLAAWCVCATAFELYQNSGDRDLAERHLALSRETIMKLANSLPEVESLRQNISQRRWFAKSWATLRLHGCMPGKLDAALADWPRVRVHPEVQETRSRHHPGFPTTLIR